MHSHCAWCIARFGQHALKPQHAWFRQELLRLGKSDVHAGNSRKRFGCGFCGSTLVGYSKATPGTRTNETHNKRILTVFKGTKSGDSHRHSTSGLLIKGMLEEVVCFLGACF